MTKTLKHPLWTHAPAAALLLATLALLWSAWPLPDPAPVHFGRDGAPDRMGASWELPLAFLLSSLLALGVSVAIDEAWARQEKRKRFNLFAMGDELLLAFLAGTTLDYVRTLVRGDPYIFHLSWGSTILLVAAAIASSAALEGLRPFRPSRHLLPPGPNASLEKELLLRRVQGRPWMYWESQNPRYARVFFPVLGLGLLVLGVTTWSDDRRAALAAGAAGLLVLLLAAGGLRVSVNGERLRLSAGLLDLRLLQLPLEEISRAEVHAFSPLADFGGYGIRKNREMTAYFLEGDRGVKLTTVGGKKYLIGSRQPERLTAVLRAATQFTR